MAGIARCSSWGWRAGSGSSPADNLPAQIVAELLGMVVLVAEGVEKLHLGKRYLPFAYFLAAAVLALALVLHRRAHRAGHAAEKGAPG